jgi:hypothetical protein
MPNAVRTGRMREGEEDPTLPERALPPHQRRVVRKARPTAVAPRRHRISPATATGRTAIHRHPFPASLPRRLATPPCPKHIVHRSATAPDHPSKAPNSFSGAGDPHPNPKSGEPAHPTHHPKFYSEPPPAPPRQAASAPSSARSRLDGIFSAVARRGVANTGSGSGEVFSAVVRRGVAGTGSGGEVTSPSLHFSRSPVR